MDALAALTEKAAVHATMLPHRATFAQYARGWLERKRELVAPRTWTAYEQRLREWVIPQLGHVKLRDLKPSHVTALYAFAISSGRRGSCEALRAATSAVLTDAMRDELAMRNVADSRLAPIPQHWDPPQLKIPTENELAAIANVAACDPLAPRWALMLHLGLRTGEVLGLEHSSFDLDAGTVPIRAQLQRLRRVHGCGAAAGSLQWQCGQQRPSLCPSGYVHLPQGQALRHVIDDHYLTPPKSETSVRRLPLTDELVALDSRYQRRHRLNDATRAHVPAHSVPHLVWRDPKGGVLTPARDYLLWRTLVARAGVPGVTRHDVRHAVATVLTNSGTPQPIITRMLGHSSSAITQQYQHATFDDTMRAVQLVQHRISAAVPAD